MHQIFVQQVAERGLTVAATYARSKAAKRTSLTLLGSTVEPRGHCGPGNEFAVGGTSSVIIQRNPTLEQPPRCWCRRWWYEARGREARDAPTVHNLMRNTHDDQHAEEERRKNDLS